MFRRTGGGGQVFGKGSPSVLPVLQRTSRGPARGPHIVVTGCVLWFLQALFLAAYHKAPLVGSAQKIAIIGHSYFDIIDQSQSRCRCNKAEHENNDCKALSTGCLNYCGRTVSASNFSPTIVRFSG